MRDGYLYLTPCADLPGAVCLHEAAVPPTGDATTPVIAYFWDVDAAAMHFHTGLRRRLLDPDRKAYRADMVEAAAVLDAIELRHQRTYVSPALAASPELDAAAARLRRQHQLVRRMFDWAGVVGLLLLLYTALLSF
ncbi:hypothetical protein [Thiohalocapsa sp. ML1]|jgi:hypothetical protein|uniref:hypothetical protein n=1 Tax=Thiohalocapsa sp. ML1 TaxID=1431688 RepID=UPI0007321851|nr:hypothetical protein [Thiohalocapsa sp. ML1]